MPHCENSQQKQNMNVNNVNSKANRSKSKKNKENQSSTLIRNNLQQVMSQIKQTNSLSGIKYALLSQKDDEFNKVYYQKQLQKINHQSTSQLSIQKLLCSGLLQLYIVKYKPEIKKQLFCVMKQLQSRNYSPNQQVQAQLRIHQFSATNKNNKHIHSQNEQDLLELKTMLKKLEFMGFFSLYSEQNALNDIIKRLLLNWDQFSSLHQPVFERFIILITTKIEFMPNSSIIYPQMSYIKRKLQHKISYVASKGKNKTDYRFEELFFEHYIQSLMMRNKGEEYYFKDDSQKITFEQFIYVSKNYFEGNRFWKDIFMIMTNYLSNDNTKDREFSSRFVLNVPNSVFSCQNCLGCSRVFYKNINLNQERCKHMKALLGSSKEIMNNQNTIKDEICAMLNGLGGVLLFDCIKSFDHVFAKGRLLFEGEKIDFQKNLANNIKGIYPIPVIGENIFITWVPLVQGPFKIQQVPTTKDFNFIKGTYVARITVKPTFGHIAYYWTLNGRPVMSIRTKSLVPEGKRKIEEKDAGTFMHKKFNDHKYELKDLPPFELKIVQNVVCSINHQCENPQIGLQVKESHVIYKCTCGIIAKKSNHQVIRKSIQKYDIQCVILAPFENKKLNGADCIGLLYTNTDFEKICSVINNNKDFQFDGQNLRAFPITKYIRLIDRHQDNIMSKIDFDSLAKWLQSDYQNETLRMWRYQYERKAQEFYIQTGSKESSLFIWLIANHFLEKSSFKNPKGLEEMNAHERNQRLKLLYTSKK